jgi:hypothetical protein
MKHKEANRKRRSARLLFGLLLVLLTVTASRAQVTQGSIVGSVKDPKGAALTGAAVTLTNIDTNVVRTTTTDKSGNYDFESVVAGHYNLDVESSGFEKWETAGFLLQVRQNLHLDANLKLGSVQAQVTVDGNAVSAIQTESPTISGTFSTEMALSLPVNTRASFTGTSAANILGTLPGMQNDSSGWSLQGALPFMSDVTVDGTTLHFTNTANSFPSSEAISEIRADGVLANAEYGDPGQVILSTKSGTNRLHGSAFWYYQSSAFDAIAYTYPTTIIKPKQLGNTYGGSAGGPVVIPHFYNGHNKSFFFGAFEGWQHPAQSTSTAVMPSTLMMQGDFSNYSSSSFPAGSSLINPNTGANLGSQVPSSLISPIAASFLKTFYVAPNVGDPTVYTDNGVANWEKNVNDSGSSNQFNIRGDQYFGANQKFLLWGSFTWKNNPATAFAGWNLPDSTTTKSDRVLRIDTNWAITPMVNNEGGFALTRDASISNTPFDGTSWTNQQGFQGLQDLWFQGLPAISFHYISGMGGRLNSPGQTLMNEYSDTLMWSKGHHLMKFGFKYSTFESIGTVSFNTGNNYGTYAFASSGSRGLVNPIDFADFLMGTPFTSSYDVIQGNIDGISAHTYAFAQDEWRVNNNLTLSYGVRYEVQPPYHDKSGYIGNFETSVPLSGAVVYPKGFSNILAQAYLASANACDPDGVTATNNATVNGAPCMPVLNNEQAGLPAGLRQYPKLRFEPRFGFAWRPSGTDNWAVRGGFGMYNALMSSSSFGSLTYTVQAATTTYANSYSGPGTLKWQWPQVYAGAGNGGCTTCYGQDYFGTANQVNWKDPYTEQWSLSVDHDFGSGYAGRVSYIGSETHQLVWAPDWNTMPFSSTESAYNQPASMHKFPNWGQVATRATGADASYHSLQLEAVHRLQNGLEYNSQFTWAKALADNEGAGAGSGFAGENGGNRSITPFGPHYDFGNVAATRRLLWNTTGLYDLPVGRGKRIAGGVNRATDLLIGGWRLTSIFTWQSGSYLTPYFPGNQGDPSGTGSGLEVALAGFDMPYRQQYPDKVAGASIVPGGGRKRLGWLNGNAFTCPGDPSWVSGLACHTGAGFTASGAPRFTGPGAEHPLPIGRFGNNQVGSVEGPGYINLNSGLSKSFDIVEGVRMRVEGTFTNVLNHTNLGNPNMELDSSSFGWITSSTGGARTGQVAARLEF